LPCAQDSTVRREREKGEGRRKREKGEGRREKGEGRREKEGERQR
jgi:hypothetical protein